MTFNAEFPNRFDWGILLFTFEFSSCGDSATDMPFLLIPIQNVPYLLIK